MDSNKQIDESTKDHNLEQVRLAFSEFKNELKKLRKEQDEILSKFIKSLEMEKIESLRSKLNN